MQLQTNIPLQPQLHNQIDYDAKLMLLGSCFTENIGEKINYFKFRNLTNPFGILFHPKAIENLIVNAINEKEYTANDLLFINERWHCFETHSQFSNTNKRTLLETLNTTVKSTKKQLVESSHIVITLGTAWVYRHIESDIIVANCHKVPQKQFLKELLSVDKITESLAAIISLIKSVNPKVSLIFTISPVRHLKDGFVENSHSKANLLSSVHEIVEPRKNIFYFPSYEIMMDELRDYRFYKEDMLHPNKTAIEYIWEKFKYVWIAEKAQQTMLEIATIQKGFAHTPFNDQSEQHKQFLKSLHKKMETLKAIFPFIEF